MRQAQAQNQGQAGSSAGAQPNEDVVDADYKEEK